jgi:hypothetical protein
MSSTVAGIVPSRYLATSRSCAVWHHVVERPSIVAVPWEWPAARRYTVMTLESTVSTSYWHLMRRPQHAPQTIMTSSARMSGRYLGKVRVCLSNVRVFLYLLLIAHKRSQYACFLGAHARRATGSRAPRHVVALELTCWAQSCGTLRAERRGSKAVERIVVPESSHLGRRDLELRDTW